MWKVGKRVWKVGESVWKVGMYKKKVLICESKKGKIVKSDFHFRNKIKWVEQKKGLKWKVSRKINGGSIRNIFRIREVTLTFLL